jgi:hypothetical protein
VNAPQNHGKAKRLTASNVLEAVGDDLLRIKMHDKDRWADLGEVLGVSEDQAAKYADATAAMNIVAFARGWAEWGSRFSGSLERLIEGATGVPCPHQTQSRILKACLAIEECKEDGELTVEDIYANRTTLEHARDAIDAQLSRLGPKGATA